MTRLLRAALAVASMIVAAAPGTAATLQVSSTGQLLGATGVAVGSAFYDVSFLDGTCAEVFGDCSGPDMPAQDPATLIFHDAASATLAGRALLDQVFLDGPQGLFDSQPDGTEGCAASNVCYALIPFAFQSGGLLNAVMAVNNTVDMTLQFSFGTGHDLRDVQTMTYAAFRPAGTAAPSLTPVPLPVPALLLVAGMGGLAAMRRARRL